MEAFVIGVFVYPHAHDHHWGVDKWAAVATTGFSIFGLLGILGGLAGVLLTVQYVRANNRIQRATERTLQATLHANDLSRRALATSEGMLTANRDMVAEMRESRLAEVRPDVLVAFKVINSRICLLVGNYGGGAAIDVRFAFHPPLINSADQVISEQPALSLGFPLLPPREPGEQIYFDEQRNYFDIEYLLGNRPAFFNVTVSYRESSPSQEEVVRTARASLAHLAPKPPADYQISEFEEEVGRARHWSHYSTLTDADRRMVEQTEAFVLRHVARELDMKDAGDAHRALQEHGWGVWFKVQHGGLLQAASKNQGSHRGHVVAAAGPSPRAALLRLLEAALVFDTEHPSPRPIIVAERE